MSDRFFAAAELRVPQEAIPAVREVLQTMLDDIEPLKTSLGRDGWMQQAWLEDPVSVAVKEAYNDYVMKSADGMYAALLKYRDQIQAAVQALIEAEKHYNRAEGDLVLKLT